MEDLQDDVERFRAIFDLCDEDKDGYIDVDHFTELAKDHFGAESVEEITGVINLLDPEGRGLISFDDFCRGVGQILELQQQAQSGKIRSSVSIDTLVPLDIAGGFTSLHSPQETSSTPTSQSTFAEYDFDGLVDLSPSTAPTTPVNTTTSSYLDELTGLGSPDTSTTTNTTATTFVNNSSFFDEGLLVPQFNSTVLPPQGGSEDEGDSALSGRSSEVNESSRPEITDEENYEDYGEVESEADISDHGLTPVTARKRGDKKDLLSRSHKKACTNRRLTTAALASQLQRSSREPTPNGTRRSSFGSDDFCNDIDDRFQDFNDRVKHLESELLRLTQRDIEHETKYSRQKEENNTLVNKVLSLEEHLRDMDLKTKEEILKERKAAQDLRARYDRDMLQEKDELAQRLHKAETEYETAREQTAKLRLEVDKLRNEKIDLQERMLEKQEMYNMLYDDNERLKAEYHKQEELHQQERRSTGQLLDEMGRELEELRRFKIGVEAGTRSPGGSVSDIPRHYKELQSEIHKLKETMWDEYKALMKENRGLQSSNEDLNAQLMGRCVEEGKSLLQDVASSKTLAEELEHLTKEELLEQLRQERDFSFRLKQYVDRIIITILEKNPSLLEITRQA